MGTLSVVVSIWVLVATCAALFIRGASPRLQRATVMAERRQLKAPLAE
ncbi:MAG: hypothetical protein ACTHKH_10960 [Trinickia sp.]|jgi:hypothetical protein